VHRLHIIVATFMALCLAACAGKVDYIKPTSKASPSANAKIIGKPRAAVWSASVPELGKQFFVINNLDKSSGFINVSYNGDPEQFIDCGRIKSYVKSAKGQRTYDFAGAKGYQSYEVMDPAVGWLFIERKMSLEGRVNLVFEEVSPTQTRITAITRYVVQRVYTDRNAAGNNIPQTRTDSISFNSGGRASFPPTSDGRAVECVAKGALEREILAAVR